MKACKKILNRFNMSLFVIALLAMPVITDAQRMRHAAPARGGGGGFSRPSGGGASRPSGGRINGGSLKSNSRPATSNKSFGKANSGNRPGNNSAKDKLGNRNNSGDRNIGNKNNIGNKVNIDNSKRNVNINVDKSKDINIHNNRNTVVRHNNINSYHRPPYVWGGSRYYCYHPYFYHPYRPFYWGPVWHPWGFFVATLATTAIIVSIENTKYHYDQGVWYEPSGSGYTVVQAPVGGTVTTIPNNAETVTVNNTTNYYYGGAYYEKDGTTYKVVPPPAGAVVENLPEGGEEVKIGDQTYVKIGETYYQPVEGNKYEVAQVEDGDK